MALRFVVVDHGLDAGVYKIHACETARLRNEFGEENIEIYDGLEAAKSAATLILSRLDEALRDSQWRFSFRADPQIESLETELAKLTEDSVETFFV